MNTRASVVARGVAVGVVATRIARAASALPAIAATDRSGLPISVVIPARDEAERLGPLLDAVIGAPDVVEVIVVDDESSDSTRSVADRPGVTLVVGSPPGPGWAGKTWALAQGIAAADGEWVVTLDADARPSPRLPRALVSRCCVDRLDLLTVAGRFVGGSPGARWLHGAMLTTLVQRFGPPGRIVTGPGDRRIARLLANGQCMTFRNDATTADGLLAVGGSTVEDVALARTTARAGGRVGFLDAGSLLDVLQYGSLLDTWTGWGRSLGLPGVDVRRQRAVDVVILAAAFPWPVLRIVTGGRDAIDVAAMALRIGTLAGTAGAYERHGAVYWLSPLADPLAIVALALRLPLRSSSWRGRVARS